MNIALMASGTGTNAINLIDQSAKFKNIKIIGIIVDQAQSKLLEQKLNIPVLLIERSSSMTRRDHERLIEVQLKNWNIDWILLAGFMRILSKKFISHYPNRIMNIHPSLLPLFPGANAYEDAFNANVTESGITIHFVDEGVDTGEIWRQQSFKRFPDDTLDNFIYRGKEVEWSLYAEFLAWLDRNTMELT